MERHESSSNRNWAYESAAYERLVAREYLKQIPRTQEEKLAWIATAMYHGDDDSDRPTVEKAWSLETIYPGSKYLFKPSSPEGQCGITNFGLGMVLAWSGVASLDNIFYEEGTLYGADGKLSDHHAWIRVVGDDGESWRIDLTAHQYGDINPDPDGHVRIAMQADPPHMTGDHLGVNYRCIPSPDLHSPGSPLLVPVPNALTLQYKARASTPLVDYDTSKFDGRLERFMGRIEIEPGYTLGSFKPDKAGMYLDNFWYPDGWDFHQENDAQTLNEFKAREGISRLTDSNEQLLLTIEIYNRLIYERVSQTDDKTLYNWAEDCVKRVLPIYEKAYPNSRVVRDIVELRARKDMGWHKTNKLYFAAVDASDLARNNNEPDAYHVAIAALNLISIQHVNDSNLHFNASFAAIRAAQATSESDSNMSAMLSELQWQYIRLQERIIEDL